MSLDLSKINLLMKDKEVFSMDINVVKNVNGYLRELTVLVVNSVELFDKIDCQREEISMGKKEKFNENSITETSSLISRYKAASLKLIRITPPWKEPSRIYSLLVLAWVTATLIRNQLKEKSPNDSSISSSLDEVRKIIRLIEEYLEYMGPERTGFIRV